MATRKKTDTKKAKPEPTPEEIREQIGRQVLTLVDAMHHEKNIPKELIFTGIESAIQLAAERATGEEEEVVVQIDRDTGQIFAQRGDKPIEPAELGRIAAQSAKQMMIQKIREAESESVHEDYTRKKGEMVTGTIQRIDAGTAIVALGREGKHGSQGGSIESLLPRSEQIPGETHHVNERVKAVVMDVRKQGHRVKIVLSRCHPDFVRSLFEQEIPEIADHTIEIKAVAREAGYRSKVAVSSIDSKVDCVGACVGVRGSRIKNIIDELNGERIDIVRWNDSMQVMIPNALQPATISEVMLYPRLGRAIVLVAEDQLSLAIGRRGQNVRLASKLVGWDIEIMTHEELGQGVEKAEYWFRMLPHIANDDEKIEALIVEGFMSFTDLTFMEPAQLGEMLGLTEEDADDIIEVAEEMSERIEQEGEEAYLPPQEEAPAEAVEGEAAPEGEVPAEGEVAVGEYAEGEPIAGLAFEAEATPAPAAEVPQSLDALFPADAEPVPPAFENPPEAHPEAAPAEATAEQHPAEGEHPAPTAEQPHPAEPTGEHPAE